MLRNTTEKEEAKTRLFVKAERLKATLQKKQNLFMPCQKEFVICHYQCEASVLQKQGANSFTVEMLVGEINITLVRNTDFGQTPCRIKSPLACFKYKDDILCTKV